MRELENTVVKFYLTDLWTHKLAEHAPENPVHNQVRKSPIEFVVNLLAEQNADIMEVVIELKADLRTAMSELGNGLQDNFDNLAEEAKKKESKTLDVLTHIHNKINRLEDTQRFRAEPAQTFGPSVAPPVGASKASSPTPQPSGSKRSPPTQKASTSATSSERRNKPKTKFLQKPRVLYVGDSIAQNVDKKHIEDKSASKIRARRAYSSVYDKRARWPNNNVKDVTEEALNEAHENDKYDHVILSAPSVDITNLDTTKTLPTDNIEIFKQDIIISCKNMMSTAQNAIIANPNIKTVTVVEHPPRFDTADTDPLSIKPELAIFANSVFRQLWFESPLKHKIVLAQHKLDCSDATRQDKYTDRKTGMMEYTCMVNQERKHTRLMSCQ